MACCCIVISLIAIVFATKFLKIIYQQFIQKPTDLKKFGAKQDSWALITGASDGIGHQFANEFGKAGFNLLLVSRTKSKLDEVAKEIEAKYPEIKIQVVAIDFANATEADYSNLKNVCDNLKISVLVNNVGTNHSFPTPFSEEKPELLEAICTVNNTTAVKLTRMLLPKMIADKKGLVLNMGSFSGMLPTPLLTTYSATKSFLITWTKCLASELEGTGVHVQLFNTYFVTTKMSKIRRATALIPTAEDYVKSAMNAIGKTHVSAPYFTHALAEFVINLCPESIAIKINHNMNKNTRARALRKQERLAKEAKQQ
ncbi:3-ketoacyl-CoA reductase [Piromyces finnis]|uniref:3-ketoacyl-CoA reductase n=1 Tax=Piromyces finnis TaxID=1754191 RepID=A0A1Y1VDE6_9FUNG|nr:3-ketoacyl-CoA reductase [Piromyces finnis]|eukprot:ORX53429.1 3-ketoacyl-CoA reductase [Piromyces finnis]